MMVVRRYVPSGSLRDLIYGVRPTLCKDVEIHTCSHPTHPHTHPHTFIHTSHPPTLTHSFTHHIPHTLTHIHSHITSHTPSHPPSHTFIHTSHPTHPHTFIHTSHPTHPHTHPHTSHPTHPHMHPHTHHIPHTLTYPTGKTQQSHTPEVCISTSQASVNVYSRHQEIWQTGFGGTSFPVRKRVCPRYDILKGRMLSAPSNYNKTGGVYTSVLPSPRPRSFW